MKRRRIRLEVALPVSVLSVEPDIMTKTLKTGFIARYLSIFKVDGLALYMDPNSSVKDLELMKLILNYVLTAPYLRKKLFKLSAALRYAGLLPPLQIPTHGVGGPRCGEIREALILRRKHRCLVVDAGLDKALEVCLEDPASLARCVKPGRRTIYVKITSAEPLSAEVACDPEVYTGFEVKSYTSLRSVLQYYRAKSFYVVATSRKGVDVRDVIKDVSSSVVKHQGVLLVFGSPKLGLYEIAELEGFSLEDHVDVVLNTIPRQGVLTVRTEEALAATLAIFNLLLENKHSEECGQLHLLRRGSKPP